ncbi:MAG TPA: hypothetical protein V6D15_07830 [Oculatellaceae cyanobacterium]|jgi:hypothetical protein
MKHIFQNSQRLISVCLVTLVLVTSTLLSFPAPARAGDLVILKCESDCGNNMAFAAGMVAGSAVTMAATGSGGGVAAAGTTAIVDAAMMAAPLAAAAAPLAVAAAPVLVPVAATVAVGYGAYRLLEGNNNSQKKASK